MAKRRLSWKYLRRRGHESAARHPVGARAQGCRGGHRRWRVESQSCIDHPRRIRADQAENQFNEAPAPGNQFYMVRVAVTYVGASSGSPSSLTFRSLGVSGVAFDQYQNSCGVLPDRLPSNEAFPGGAVEGNVCWSIRSSDVASLTMLVADSDAATYFALV